MPVNNISRKHFTFTGKTTKPVISTTEHRRGQDWRECLILPEVSIRDSLQIMDTANLRLLLVTDSSLELLGVVTDGDIRRGLIDGLCLTAPISLVMNNQAITAPVHTPVNELLEMMRTLDVLGIPLVDNGKVVGLQTIKQDVNYASHQNPVFLMAGGGGTRLRPLTEDCPKPLLRVGDKPILEQIIRRFAKNGFRNFYISTHYIPEKIRNYFGNGEKWGVTIQYVHEESPLGTAGALGLLPDNLPDLPVIMMNGDVLTDIDFTKLLAFHLQQKCDATICAREYEHQVPYGVIQDQDLDMLGMIEKPVYKYKINAGIYVLNSSVVKQVQKNQNLDMPALLEQQIANNRKVKTYTINEYWLDIGNMADFRRAQTDINTLNT